MENNKQSVNRRLEFCFRKFPYIRKAALGIFLSDADVEKELLSAIDNNITIDEWLLNSIAKSLYIERYIDDLPNYRIAYEIYKKTSVKLGLADEQSLQKEHKEFKERKANERRSQST